MLKSLSLSPRTGYFANETMLAPSGMTRVGQVHRHRAPCRHRHRGLVTVAALATVLRGSHMSSCWVQSREHNHEEHRQRVWPDRATSLVSNRPTTPAKTWEGADTPADLSRWANTWLLRSCCSLLAIALLGAVSMSPVGAKEAERPTATISPDLAIAPLPPAEQARRRVPTAEIKVEKWYRQGQRSFGKSCAGCHPAGLEGGGRQDRVLTTELLAEKKYKTDEQIQYIIRYGNKKMPGYAADCADFNEYAICYSVTPLSEEGLRNVQDYMVSRAAEGWQGKK